jgi:hypothetical protein
MKLNRENVLQVIMDWEDIEWDVDNDNMDAYEDQFEQVYEDEEVIDRYFHSSVNDDVEFMITTDKNENETHLSEVMTIKFDECGEPQDYEIDELRDYIVNGCEWRDRRMC